MIREAIEIRRTPNINRDDGYKLSSTWNPLLKMFPPPNAERKDVKQDKVNVATSSPPEDISDNRYFNRPFQSHLERYDTLERYNQDLANLEQSLEDSLFGSPTNNNQEPAFCVTQLIHAQDRYYDLSAKKHLRSTAAKDPGLLDRNLAVKAVKSAGSSASTSSGRKGSSAIYRTPVKTVLVQSEHKEWRDSEDSNPGSHRLSPVKKKHRETSFAIIAEATPVQSRSTSPNSRSGRVSPFRGRGFKQDPLSRHTTPRESRVNSPEITISRTASLTNLERVIQVKPTVSFDVKMPLSAFEPPIPGRDFIRENMKEVKEMSNMNREKNIEEAEMRRQEEEIAILQEMGILSKETSRINSRVNSRGNSRASSPGRNRSLSPKKSSLRSRSNSPSAILQYENIDTEAETTDKSSSPKRTSKIPRRKTSVSPPRILKNTRFISNSTSSINESKFPAKMADASKRGSRSSQNLGLQPDNLRSKPPRSPARLLPPATNKNSTRRLSPIVGTPNKEDKEEKTVTSPSRIPKAAQTIKKPPKSKAAAAVSAPKKPITRNESTKSLKSIPPPVKSVSARSTRDPPKKDSSISSKPTKSVSSTTTPKKNMQTQFDSPQKLIPLTKNNVVSMTTAAIASQPLDVVAKVTSQLPAALEKAKERGVFERNSSNESIDKNGDEDKRKLEKNSSRTSLASVKEEKQPALSRSGTIIEDNMKLKPLKPPLDPQVAKVKKKIEQILNSPETGTSLVTEIAVEAEKKVKEAKAEVAKAKEDAKKIAEEAKAEVEKKIVEEKVHVVQIETDVKKNAEEVKDTAVKQVNAAISQVGTSETKLEGKVLNGFNHVLTPVEEPLVTVIKVEHKKPIDPVVTIVNEKKPMDTLTTNRSFVRGEAEAEVQGSNMSTPSFKMAAPDASSVRKMASGNSNGELPKSTSTTTSSIRTLGPNPQLTRTPASPLPMQKNEDRKNEDQKIGDGKNKDTDKVVPEQSRLSRCCAPCCSKLRCWKKKEGEELEREKMQKMEKEKKKEELKKQKEEEKEKKRKMENESENKTKFIDKINCFKKRKHETPLSEVQPALELPKTVSQTESSGDAEEKKPSPFDCISCKRRNKIGDSSADELPSKTGDRGWLCCKRSSKRIRNERSDSIISQTQTPRKCCGRGSSLLCCLPSACCRRKARSEESAISRRTSNFSKNKSLSPTLPPEDTRPKLDPSLVEHTSAIRGALPALPIPLAWICLVCNVVIPGLGTVLSGMFCLCFGIPRFNIYDGFRRRIGAFIIDIIIGCGQLFTVLFCLVGWGWSIWWGLILLRVARKYKKLKLAAEQGDAEAGTTAPAVTAQNHFGN